MTIVDSFPFGAQSTIWNPNTKSFGKDRQHESTSKKEQNGNGRT